VRKIFGAAATAFRPGRKKVKTRNRIFRTIARKLRRVRGLYGQTVKTCVHGISPLLFLDGPKHYRLAVPVICGPPLSAGALGAQRASLSVCSKRSASFQAGSKTGSKWMSHPCVMKLGWVGFDRQPCARVPRIALQHWAHGRSCTVTAGTTHQRGMAAFTGRIYVS